MTTKRIATIVGGVALLAATLVDTVSVSLRHLGMAFTGSIELMQAIVLVSAGLGLVIATWDDSHARVKLLVDRLTGGKRRAADALSDLLTMVFLLALLAGSGWLAADLWNGHEQSELLGIPWALLRAIANLCLLCTATLLLLRMTGRQRP